MPTCLLCLLLLWPASWRVNCCVRLSEAELVRTYLSWFDRCNATSYKSVRLRGHQRTQSHMSRYFCCFGEHKVVLFQILLDGAEHMMRGRPSCLLQSAGGEANRILLASALSSMLIICPNRVSRRDWIIAVSLGCFVSLRTSSFCTNWYHLMPSSICRHHLSSASILRASVLDIAQQSEPYRTAQFQIELSSD